MRSTRGSLVITFTIIVLSFTALALGAEAQPFIVTDKSVYKPGEKVVIRGKLATSSGWIVVEVRGPNGELVYINQTSTSSGIFSFSFRLPKRAKPGNYTVYAAMGEKRATAEFKVIAGVSSDAGGEGGPVIYTTIATPTSVADNKGRIGLLRELLFIAGLGIASILIFIYISRRK